MSGPETLPSLPTQRRLNPLIGAAAVSIVVASLAAVAAITGVLPISKANQGGTEPTAAQYNAQPATQAETQTPAPGSTTRPPAYDRQYAQNAMPQAPAQQQQQQQQQPSQTEPNTAARASHTAGHVTGVQAVESEKPTSGLGAVGLSLIHI